MRGRHPIRLVGDPGSISASPVAWALEQLGSTSAAVSVEPAATLDFERPDVILATATSSLGRTLLSRHAVDEPEGPESYVLFSAAQTEEGPVVAVGSDARGIAYAVLELAERPLRADHPFGAVTEPIRGRPANAIRGVARAFVSEGADKPWFHDEGFWRGYLDRLARERFNRFHLALGMGYDFHYQDLVTDTYLVFPYPFLLRVPGYDVVAEGLPEEEADRNLATLRLVSDEAARRGLHFQLGLWTHGYAWTEGDGINYRVRGLTPENHAAYCREAVTRVLDACPSIGGVTLRVHGESGIGEDAADFWPQVFAGIADAGRRVEIDLHAKGLAHEVVDAAVASGMPVVVSPKYAGEHLGLPYHLTSIRGYEQRSRMTGGAPGATDTPSALRSIMQLSAGTRVFTRYSYGDFLRQDRPYDVLFRIWPGTQRLLRWGDPAFAAALSRSGSFGGAAGIEVCEPMYFAGRRGSPGEAVRSARGSDTYAGTYRILGRHLYDPATTSSSRDGGTAQQDALAPASRILPLITMAHCPSAANNRYWPEIYTNMPIVAGLPHHYRDTPMPRTFGSVSALDPAVFSSVDEFVSEALAGELSGRYTPLQVAGWLEELATAASRLAGPDPKESALDALVQAGLGRFFAGKLRAAVLYELGRRLGEGQLHQAAVEQYRAARSAWSELATLAGGAYGSDLVFGPEPWLRGNWGDRLGAIDEDLRAMEGQSSPGAARDDASATAWLGHLQAITPPPAPRSAVRVREVCGAAPDVVVVTAEVTLATPHGPAARVRLHHRPINQAARYSGVEMMRPDFSRPSGFTVSIPRDATFGTQYYLTVTTAAGGRWIYPGIGTDLLQQPYLVVRQREQDGGPTTAATGKESGSRA